MTLGTWNDRKENDIIDPNDINSVAHAVISLENSAVVVDQTYNSTSQNAQSGTAVAQAIAEADFGGGASSLTIVTKSVTLDKDNWSESGAMSGVSMGYMGDVWFGRTPNTTNLKVLLVDINQHSTLEQRKAAEEACIYASFFAMEPENEYDWYVYLGITGTVPTVDIPITVTAIFEGATS